MTSANDKAISIKWELPEDNGGSDITKYHVEVRESLRHSWQRVSTVGADDALEHTSTHLMVGQQYMFRVAAENDVGVSDYAELAKPVLAKSKFGEYKIMKDYHFSHKTPMFEFHKTCPIVTFVVLVNSHQR